MSDASHSRSFHIVAKMNKALDEIRAGMKHKGRDLVLKKSRGYRSTQSNLGESSTLALATSSATT